jgi:hypothetical protein
MDMNFFALLWKLYNFVSDSYVHLKCLTVQKELYPEQQPRELQRLTDVRWAGRYMACCNLRDRLPAVLRVLQVITLGNSGDRSVEAKGRSFSDRNVNLRAFGYLL